jgi:hypothetical protein
VAESCELVLSMLPNNDAVRAVGLGKGGLAEATTGTTSASAELAAGCGRFTIPPLGSLKPAMILNAVDLPHGVGERGTGLHLAVQALCERARGLVTHRPQRAGENAGAIEGAHPRGEGFRTSAEYAALCRRVSEALAAASAAAAER